MALKTVDDEDTGDFCSEAGWAAGKKLDVVLRLPLVVLMLSRFSHCDLRGL